MKSQTVETVNFIKHLSVCSVWSHCLFIFELCKDFFFLVSYIGVLYLFGSLGPLPLSIWCKLNRQHIASKTWKKKKTQNLYKKCFIFHFQFVYFKIILISNEKVRLHWIQSCVIMCNIKSFCINFYIDFILYIVYDLEICIYYNEILPCISMKNL